jgi:hypothetical protein
MELAMPRMNTCINTQTQVEITFTCRLQPDRGALVETCQKGAKLLSDFAKRATTIGYFLFLGIVFAGQALTFNAPSYLAPSCGGESLPREIRLRLSAEYPNWRIKSPAQLGQSARANWLSRLPVRCPGIAAGMFQQKQQSYAVLLVPFDNSDSAYRLIVFSRSAKRNNFAMMVVGEYKNGGANNYFIRSVPLTHFLDRYYDEKIGELIPILTKYGIELIDAGEKEYGTVIFVWVNGAYRSEAVDD